MPCSPEPSDLEDSDKRLMGIVSCDPISSPYAGGADAVAGLPASSKVTRPVSTDVPSDIVFRLSFRVAASISRLFPRVTTLSD